MLFPQVKSLSPAPGAKATGRVEMAWNGVRVTCIVLGLLAAYITPFIGAVAVLLMSAAILATHLQVPPAPWAVIPPHAGTRPRGMSVQTNTRRPRRAAPLPACSAAAAARCPAQALLQVRARRHAGTSSRARSGAPRPGPVTPLYAYRPPEG